VGVGVLDGLGGGGGVLLVDGVKFGPGGIGGCGRGHLKAVSSDIRRLF
jgi:hypothetical protein